MEKELYPRDRPTELEFEGQTLILDWKKQILPGDIYVARRNQGWRLLTANFIKHNAVFPKENAYPYDIWECATVVDIV